MRANRRAESSIVGGSEAPLAIGAGCTDNARATWGGTACTPYDTERSPGFSSGGSGVSVAANLVTCAICETTGGSCRIPANPNNVASLATTKGLITSDRGWTVQHINHRPGVLCRSLGDAALVLDALKDPNSGYFDPNDMFTALPKGLISQKRAVTASSPNADQHDVLGRPRR